MNFHFCKVGKTITSNNKSFSLKHAENRYIRFREETSNFEPIDMSLSDLSCYKSKKLKLHVVNLKRTNSKYLDVVF